MARILRGAGWWLLCTPPFPSLHKSQRLLHQVIYMLEDPRTNVVHYVGRTGIWSVATVAIYTQPFVTPFARNSRSTGRGSFTNWVSAPR